ncbi:MAG TPA: ATP-binding protein [Fontimonas sp.]
MLRRIIVIVAMFMALAVLGLLLLKTQAQPLELQRHNERLSHLEKVIELEAATDREIARARLTLDAEPPTLESSLEALANARQRMRGSWLPKDKLPAELDQAARDYFARASAKNDLLVEYRSDLERFFAAFKQLRRLVDPVVAELATEPRAALRRDVMSLLSELTSYCIQSSPDNGPTVAALQASISNDSRKFGDAALARGLDRLLAAVDSVRETKDGLRGVTEELAAIPTTPLLQQARRQYYAYYAEEEAAVARYRQALAIYALALLIVFGLGGLRLRRSYAELDRANTGLEELVAVRTQELRSALMEVRQQQTQLIQSEKMASLGQLVAGVAHEINTPLGYARSNVETVRDTLPALSGLIEAYESALPQDLSAEHAERLQQAKRRWDPAESPEEMKLLLGDAEHGLVQITDLVLSLKDFSRVDRSQTEHFDINSGLETALKICQGQLKGRIEIEREYGELPLVQCAPSQLNQVFLNLITNAAQAIDGPGWLRLRTRRVGDSVEIAVADSGCGMDEQTQLHIFEPFFTTKDVGKGTGLGLSIVFRILEDHKGSISVESTPGKGTEFTIRLPIGGSARSSRPATPALSESGA